MEIFVVRSGSYQIEVWKGASEHIGDVSHWKGASDKGRGIRQFARYLSFSKTLL